MTIKNQKSLWGKLLNYEANSSFSQEEDLIIFVTFLKKYLSLLDYIPLSTFLSQLFEEKRSFFMEKYGQEALEVYENFYQTVINLEKRFSFTMQDLVYYLNKNDIDIKKDTSSKNFSQIRLMTIHGSKGLEAPVVILADANIRTTLQKERLLKYKDRLLLKPSDKDCPKTLKINKQESLDTLKEEEQRLLYVAMTRARDHLYIFGKGSHVQDSWYEKLSQSLDIKSLPIFEERHQQQECKEGDFTVPQYFFDPVDKADFVQPDFLKSQEIERGILIHKLFEDIINVDDREEYVNHFCAIHKNNISPDDLNKILLLLKSKDFTYIFNKDGINEMSFSYKGELYRIDRFIQTEGKSIIVDFKTGKRTQKKQDSYKAQMQIYKNAINEIFTNTVIECHILWIDDFFIEIIEI